MEHQLMGNLDNIKWEGSSRCKCLLTCSQDNNKCNHGTTTANHLHMAHLLTANSQFMDNNLFMANDFNIINPFYRNDFFEI
jgi:hypothetical protein